MLVNTGSDLFAVCYWPRDSAGVGGSVPTWGAGTLLRPIEIYARLGPGANRGSRGYPDRNVSIYANSV